jgi:hypothetical protein
MIRTIHDKLNASCDLTEFADNQFVAIPFVMMRNMTFKF